MCVVSEVDNADTDLNAYENKTYEEDDNINFFDKEEQKTVGYQETLKTDIKNIDQNIKTIKIPIYEVIDKTFFEKQTFSQNILKNI